MASLRLEGVTKRFGQVTALNDVSLEIEDGEFFAVLGPPGAGKTTLLRTIVGLEKPDEGDVFADGERITDVYPGDRDIAIVFQNLALYPDKTVFGNLSFPLRQSKVPRKEIRERVGRTAEILHIEHLLDRKPAKLSGGERQRVALGRALVRDPRAYLFDEPLSALDALLRLEMRAELKHLQRDLGRTLVYVTHDQVEAMSMADHIAVMNLGVLQQYGTPAEIYGSPANRFVAGFVGSTQMNFMPPSVAGVQPPKNGAANVSVGIRPENLRIVAADSADAPMRAKVTLVEPLGAKDVVHLSLDGHEVRVVGTPGQRPRIGENVGLIPDTDSIHFFDDETGQVVR
jgi:ABC-type sugar transport system ATPase subunit